MIQGRLGREANEKGSGRKKIIMIHACMHSKTGRIQHSITQQRPNEDSRWQKTWTFAIDQRLDLEAGSMALKQMNKPRHDNPASLTAKPEASSASIVNKTNTTQRRRGSRRLKKKIHIKHEQMFKYQNKYIDTFGPRILRIINVYSFFSPESFFCLGPISFIPIIHNKSQPIPCAVPLRVPRLPSPKAIF